MNVMIKSTKMLLYHSFLQKVPSFLINIRKFHSTQSKHLLKSNFLLLNQEMTSSKLFALSACNISHRRYYYTNRNILKLSERGIWQDRFPPTGKEFEDSITKDQQHIYAGFDPTADALHIGNLLILIALMHCQRAGHKPIVLLGGFTSTIGDPTGRTTQRLELEESAAESNLNRIKDSIVNIFRNHKNIFWAHEDSHPLQNMQIVNNKDWLSKMTSEDFLSIAANIPVKYLLSSSFVRDRIASRDPFMLKEILYPVFQAYDWLHLYDEHNCKIQIGGNDQSGNIFRGHDLIRDIRGDSVTGLTVPLLTTADGQKLGKSAGNSIWLCPNKTSYLDFYQHFYRTLDTDIEKLLKLFSFYPLKQIEEIMEKHKSDTGAQYAQNMLAKSVTRLVHGEYGLKIAQKSTEILYNRNAKALLDLKPIDLEMLFNGHICKLSLKPGLTVLETAMAAKCFRSEREAQNIIKDGGFHINQSKIQEPYLALIPDAHILPTGYTLLGIGKRNYKLVHWMT